MLNHLEADHKIDGGVVKREIDQIANHKVDVLRCTKLGFCDCFGGKVDCRNLRSACASEERAAVSYAAASVQDALSLRCLRSKHVPRPMLSRYSLIGLWPGNKALCYPAHVPREVSRRSYDLSFVRSSGLVGSEGHVNLTICYCVQLRNFGPGDRQQPDW